MGQVLRDGLVERTELPLSKGQPIHIVPLNLDEWDKRRFNYTMKNLDSMIKEGREIVLVIPSKILNSRELEEYRKYYCSYAKVMKKNYVYLQGPAKVDIVEAT